jgi:hypothetical protein
MLSRLAISSRSLQAAALSLPMAFFAVATGSSFEPALVPRSEVLSPVPDYLLEPGRILLQMALKLVSERPPKSLVNNLYNWTADRAVLKNKTLNVILTTSDNKELQNLLQAAGLTAVPTETDSFTGELAHAGSSEIEIDTFIFLDKILVKDDLVDGFSRLTQALAHSFFGPVQSYLETPFGQEQDHRQVEMRALRLSIEFLNGLIADPEFKELPPQARDAFAARLENEKGNLSLLEAQPPSR